MSPQHFSSSPAGSRGRRRRFVPLIWVGSLSAVAVLALGVSGSFSGFTASINNTTDTAGTGSIVMEETSGGTNCFSTATATAITTNAGTCATINKLGGNLLMSPSATVVPVPVTITNIGTSPVTTAFTLTPTGCTTSAGSGGNAGSDTSGFCGKIDEAIWDSTDGKCIVGPPAGTVTTCVPSSTYTLASMGTTALTLTVPIAAAGSKVFSVMTQVDSSATNADMNLQVSDPLTWAFQA